MEKVQLNQWQGGKLVRVWHKIMGTPWSADTKASDCLAWVMSSDVNRKKYTANQELYWTTRGKAYDKARDPVMCAINGTIPKPIKQESKPKTRKPRVRKPEPLGALRHALEAAGYKGSFAVIKIK